MCTPRIRSYDELRQLNQGAERSVRERRCLASGFVTPTSRVTGKAGSVLGLTKYRWSNAGKSVETSL